MPASDLNPHNDPQKTVASPLPAHAAHAADATRAMPRAAGAPAGSHAPAHAKHASGGTSSNQPRSPHAPAKPHRRGRGCLIALIVIVVLIAAAYAGGVAVFSTIYYPGTTIAGTDVSLVDAGSAATRIRSSMNRFTLTVEGSGFSWQYQPESADSFFDADAAARAVLEQNDPMRWPVHLFEALNASKPASTDEQTVDLSAQPDFSLFSDSFDEAAFRESLGAAVDAFNEGRSGTFDAASSFDADAGAFTVDKARANEKLDRDAIIAYAELELSLLHESAPLDALGDSAFLPLIDGMGDSDLQAVCDAANGLLGANFTVVMQGNEVGAVNTDQVAQWIIFDESLTPTINQDAVTSWASELADSFDTVGTKRTYVRPDGKEISVSGGTFGWAVDNEALVQSIVDAVNQKATGQIEVPTSQTGDVYNGQGARDWGAYVDIDITEQHARYYDANGNLLWESGVITGNPTKGNDTPTGVYYLRQKRQGATLRGPKDPETGEYKWESHVDYWMPFVGNSIGLHDASWQASSSFSNPDAYKSVGSHGCVNLPPDKAAELYNILEDGTCVIVHN